MKKVKVLSIVLAVVGILALALGGTILADDGDSNTPDTCQYENDHLRWGGHAIAGLHDCIEQVSELLGLSTEEIRDLREEGMSLVEIAARQEVSADDLVATIVAGISENLAEQVADGNITQERADAFLEQLPDRVTTMVNSSGPVFGQYRADGDEDGYQAGFRQGFRRGFMTGRNFDPDAGFKPGMAGRLAH